MGEQVISVISPSGSRLELAWSDEAPLTSIAAGVRFAGSSSGRGFQIGSRGHHDFAAQYMIPATLSERLIVGNRELLISVANDRTATIATLLGEHHELMTIFGGPPPVTTAIVDLFASLEIHDQPDGMRVQPRSSTLLSIMSEQVIAVTEARGSITVPGPAGAQALIPKSRGAATTHGEVWRTQLPGRAQLAAPRARDFSYVIGCPAGAAEVHLVQDGPVRDEELLEFVDSVRVAWQGANVRLGR